MQLAQCVLQHLSQAAHAPDMHCPTALQQPSQALQQVTQHFVQHSSQHSETALHG